MSNCKWFRGTNSARKGQRGQRAKRAEVGEGKVAFCGFLRFQFRLNLWATRRPPQMKCETEAKDEGRRRRRTRNLCLIFGRSSNASGCVLTLAFSLSLPSHSYSHSQFPSRRPLAWLAIRLAVCACDRMAKSHRLWVFHYGLALQRGADAEAERRVEESERESRSRSRNRSTDRRHYVYVTLVEFLSASDWQGTKS